MKDLLKEILAAGREKTGLAVVTAITVRGTADLAPGWKVLVLASGEVRGAADSPWVAAVQADGIRCIRQGCSRVIRYNWPIGDPHPLGHVEVYFDVLPAPPALVICGAGHIAVPLAKMAKVVGFHVTVIDDRPEFANCDRFPEADEVLARPFVEALRDLPIDINTYLAIITRGHSYDANCLRQVIHSPAAYIGMIGSRRRVWAVLSAMRDEGYPVEKLLRVHSPIGLPIAAETPEEIALSVLAEMVSVRRQGEKWSLAFKEGKHRELLRDGVQRPAISAVPGCEAPDVANSQGSGVRDQETVQSER